MIFQDAGMQHEFQIIFGLLLTVSHDGRTVRYYRYVDI